jgi:hypothetical protein
MESERLWISAVGWTAELLIDWRPERAGKKAASPVANPADAALAIRRIANKG